MLYTYINISYNDANMVSANVASILPRSSSPARRAAASPRRCLEKYLSLSLYIYIERDIYIYIYR